MKNGLRIKLISYITAITMIVSAVVMFVVILFGNQSLKNMQQSTDEYIICEDAARALQDASDYLCEQVRLYAVTGDKQYMEQYFYEVNVNKRRDNAVASLNFYFGETAALQYLAESLKQSKNLMQTEIYAMRLAADAYGYAADTLPKEVAKVEVAPADKALSATEKQEKAIRLVFDDSYQAFRLAIVYGVENCMEDLKAETMRLQSRATSIFHDTFWKMEAGIALLLLVYLSYCMALEQLIVKPLVVSTQCIEAEQTLPLKGAHELRILEKAINKGMEESKSARAIIQREAERDGLTELFNRRFFNKMLEQMEEDGKPFALILIDVDYFKNINDSLGHDAGDRALIVIANKLEKIFRSNDYICRVGGDEFAVIMNGLSSDKRNILIDRVERINEEVQSVNLSTEQKLSLSIGVAFADTQKTGQSIYKNADKALYQVKESGRGGWRIHE